MVLDRITFTQIPWAPNMGECSHCGCPVTLRLQNTHIAWHIRLEDPDSNGDVVISLNNDPQSYPHPVGE